MRPFYRKIKQMKETAWCPQGPTAKLRTLEKVKGFTCWSQFIFFKKELLSFEDLSFFLIRAFGDIKDLQIGVCPSYLECYKVTSSSKMSLLHLEIREEAVPHISSLFNVADCRIQSQEETFRSRIREDSDLISCRIYPREICSVSFFCCLK